MGGACGTYGGGKRGVQGSGALMCMTKMVKDDTQSSLMNSFKKSTSACVENVASRYQNFLKNFHDL